MRDCPTCGQLITEAATYCPQCGEPLDDADDLKDTLPFVPTFDRLQELQRSGTKPPDTLSDSSSVDLHDTLRDPDSLDDTLDEQGQAEQPLVTDKPLDHKDLSDTLVEVRAQQEGPQQEVGGKGPITFTEVPGQPIKGDPTGAAPLDFKEFESTDDVARRAEAERSQEQVEGQTDLLPSPPKDAIGGPALGAVQSGGLAKLSKLLAAVASLAWIALALLFLAPLLEVAVVVRWVAALPFYTEALVAAPAGLTLLTLLYAASVRGRAALLIGTGGRAKAFFGFLLWVLLSGLPALGLILGLIGAIRLIVRRRLRPEDLKSSQDHAKCDPGRVDRSVGLMLLCYTLSWQAIVALYAKPYVWPLLS